MYIRGNLQIFAFVTLGAKTKRVLYETHSDVDSTEAVELTEKARKEINARDSGIGISARFTVYM